MRIVVSLLFFSMMASPTYARCQLDRLVGYTLAAKKTVVAYIEDGKRIDGFIGCTYGRILVFDDNTGVRCAEYSYNYAYRPDAFIFLRGSSIKACIDDQFFDVAPIN